MNGNNPDRIVVGVDGSESSLQALRWARHLAEPAGTKIEAITTWQAPVGWNDGVWIDIGSPRSTAEEIVGDAVRAVYGDASANGVTTTVVPGSPAATLIEAGKTAAMIIVGSRGHGGFAGLLLGSVSSAVAEHATCPVLVVHGDRPPNIGTAR